MALDIRGSKKNTRKHGDVRIVVQELVSNAIDSYLIRKHADPTAPAMKLALTLILRADDLFGESFDGILSCTDNGAGFGDEQVKAFVTRDTSYKDDLRIDGIEQCRGSGRIQFFHHGTSLELESHFKGNDGFLKRTLHIESASKEVGERSFETSESELKQFETRLVLSGLKVKRPGRGSKELDMVSLLQANALKNHLLILFVRRLIGLQKRLGAFEILLRSEVGGGNTPTLLEEAVLTSAELPTPLIEREPVSVPDAMRALMPSESPLFFLTHYRLPEDTFPVKKHLVALCARASIVRDITARYLKPHSVEQTPLDGHFHLVLIEGAYLDKTVNAQRDDFDIPHETTQLSLMGDDRLTWEHLHEVIDERIYERITPPDWRREEVLQKVEAQFGISSSMIADAKVRVRFGDTHSNVVERVLGAYQSRIVRDTSAIVELTQTLQSLNPDEDDFREKVQELTWKYVSSLSSLDKTNLSQLVVRRAAVLKILQLTIQRHLDVQATRQQSGKARFDERLIHQIFFPMGQDSTQTQGHDIWLLNEEYQYFDYIASDKPLSTIKLPGNAPLFQPDIDDELNAIFARVNQTHQKKRPDIAILSAEGAAVIVEFKSPQEMMSDHVDDLMEYAQLLAAKSGGRLNRFYGYLLGSKLNEHRLRGFQPLVGEEGWFSTADVVEPKTRQKLGELYLELLYYNRLVERVDKRLSVYKNRLGIEHHDALKL